MWKHDFAAPRTLWPALLSKLGPGSMVNALAPLWREAVGETIGRRCTIDRFLDGELWVKTSSSSWARELAGREDELLKKLDAQLGSKVVFRLHFESP
jgi:predicted nucleic acid-binding Zn ribbon protein